MLLIQLDSRLEGACQLTSDGCVCVSRRWTDRERNALREPSDVDHERPQAGLPRQERRDRRRFGEREERET